MTSFMREGNWFNLFVCLEKQPETGANAGGKQLVQNNYSRNKWNPEEAGMYWPGCESPDAALEHGELPGPGCVPALWDAGMVPVGQLGHCRGLQWLPVGFQRSPRDPGQPSPSTACTLPALLPHRPGRGLASRFGKPRSLVPRLVRVRFHAGAGAVAGRLGPRHEGAAGHEGGAGTPHPHRGHDGAQGASGAFAQAVGRALLAGECMNTSSRVFIAGWYPWEQGRAGLPPGLGPSGSSGWEWGCSWPGWSSPFVSWTGCPGFCCKPFVRSDCGTAQSQMQLVSGIGAFVPGCQRQGGISTGIAWRHRAGKGRGKLKQMPAERKLKCV